MPAPRNKKKDQGVNLDALGLEMGNKPPQALDVEEAVLGAMLIEPAAVDEAMDVSTIPVTGWFSRRCPSSSTSTSPSIC